MITYFDNLKSEKKEKKTTLLKNYENEFLRK